jgi:hypothetical protein
MGPNDAPRDNLQSVVKTKYNNNCLQIYEQLKLGTSHCKTLGLADSLALLLRTPKVCLENFT